MRCHTAGEKVLAATRFHVRPARLRNWQVASRRRTAAVPSPAKHLLGTCVPIPPGQLYDVGQTAALFGFGVLL